MTKSTMLDPNGGGGRVVLRPSPPPSPATLLARIPSSNTLEKENERSFDAPCDEQHSTLKLTQQVRQKQRALWHLHHAATCAQESTSCNEINHCLAAKRLYKHVMACNGSHCQVPGCPEKRRLWQHYQYCKAQTEQHQACRICGPLYRVSAGGGKSEKDE